VIQSPTWDERWQINQFLGVIHDLILIIDCEQEQIYILPTEAAPNLASEAIAFSQILQELENPQESSEFTPLIQQVIQTQIAQHIIYKSDQNRQDYQILVEIYPLSKTEVIAVIKDLSQCFTVQAVLQKVSEKTPSPTLNPNPALQVTKERLKKQIEARQRIETQLQTRKTELETLMDNAGDCIVRVDQKLRYVFVNRRTAFLTQIPQKKFIGKTNPAEADKGTIRNLFGTNIQNNAVHGSDSDESAIREIHFFFGANEIFDKQGNVIELHK
jgi:PAS domain-containing protein